MPGLLNSIRNTRYQGGVGVTDNNTTSQIPVTIDVNLSNNDIELIINDDSQTLCTATHKYRCTLIERGTLPFIEILDVDNNVVVCITGTPSFILNYDLEVVPNATNTVAVFSF